MMLNVISLKTISFEQHTREIMNILNKEMQHVCYSGGRTVVQTLHKYILLANLAKLLA